MLSAIRRWVTPHSQSSSNVLTVKIQTSEEVRDISAKVAAFKSSKADLDAHLEAHQVLIQTKDQLTKTAVRLETESAQTKLALEESQIALRSNLSTKVTVLKQKKDTFSNQDAVNEIDKAIRAVLDAINSIENTTVSRTYIQMAEECYKRALLIERSK